MDQMVFGGNHALTQTWNFTTTQPPGTQTLNGVSFTNTMNGVVVAEGRHIFRTSDGGVGYAQIALLGAATIYQRQ